MIGLLSDKLEIFLNIFVHIVVLIERKLINARVEISRNVESILCIKVPNSIYLTAMYNGKSSLLLSVVWYIKRIVAVIIIKKKLAINIEVTEIFLNFSGFDKYVGKK